MVERGLELTGNLMQTLDLLFVYGSLLTGNVAREPFRRYFTAAGEGTVGGALYHLPEGYPTLILDGGADGAGRERVHGEIIRLVDPEQALVALDEYEGADPALGDGGLYVRVTTPVRLTGGDLAHCWIYACPPGAQADVEARGRRVDSGSWRTFLSGG